MNLCLPESLAPDRVKKKDRNKSNEQKCGTERERGETEKGGEDVVMVGRMRRELTLPWLVSLEARALL